MKSKTYMKKYHSEPEPVIGTIIKVLACLAMAGIFLLAAIL